MVGALDEFTIYLVAYVIQAIVFGVTLAQTLIYLLKNRDEWKLRVFIATLFAINLLSLVFIGHSVHSYLLRLRGVFNSKSILVWTASANAELIAVTIVLVQLFFARQVYLFCQLPKVIPAIAVVFALASLGFGTAAAANNIVNNTVAQLSTTKIRVCILCASSLSVASDIISVGAMCWELIKSRDTLLRTRSVVVILLYSTVNRGLLVLIWQFVWCIWAATSPTSYKWGPIFLPLPGVYTNTCLAMLNCREILRSKIDGSGADEFDVGASIEPTFATPRLTRTSETGTSESTSRRPSERSRSRARVLGLPVGGVDSFGESIPMTVTSTSTVLSGKEDFKFV